MKKKVIQINNLYLFYIIKLITMNKIFFNLISYVGPIVYIYIQYLNI